MSDLTPARKLFDLLVSRDFDPETLDAAGKPSADPSEAEIFSFDFRAESGRDYGTVVLMINTETGLEMYCADNVGKTMDEEDKTDWFNFLEQLKHFAVKNFRNTDGSWSIKNLNRLRYSMQGQAAIREGLFESWQGRKDVSYNAGPNQSRLMIKHKRALGEDEARFRYVESLFIETADGERYKLPFKNLTAGKAMLEHVRNGGRPYDMRGQHIAEMISELTVLSRFRRANHGRLLEGDTEQLVEQTNAYYENLQRNLKSLSHRRGYDAYFESWAPAEVSEESVVIEGLKHLFVTQSIDQRIEDALPLIAKIQQQENAMKEANIFEAWANQLVEGTWQLPDTPEKQAKLVELMSQNLPVGADATNVTEQLYDLLGDDELFDQLESLAEHNANADARQVIYDRMQELSDHPEVRQVIERFQIDADATMNPPAATNPADLEPTTEVEETIGGDASDELIRDIEVPEKEDALESIRRAAGLVENVLTDDTGSTLQHIKDTFKRDIKDFEKTGEISQHLHDALFDYYHDDMPYGVQKARDGDPYEWVADRFGADLGINGYGGRSPGEPDEDYTLERESVMHGDYAEEKSRMRKMAGLTDEGAVGSVLGGLAGAAVGGTSGAKIGSMLGSKVGDAMSSDKTNEAVGSHNGKPTVEYRGIFYVNQPDGSWASLRGDHVAEPAVKQVLDRMHQQSVTNEVYIDPTSKYGTDDTGAYIDLKRSAKLSADARGSAIAQAAGPKIGGGGGAGGGIQPWMAGIKSVGYQGGSNPGDKLSGADPVTGTPTPPSTGSSSSTTMPQVPPKDMGKADVIDVEEDLFGFDKDAEKEANIAAATAANTKMIPLQPYDTTKAGGPGGPEFVPVDVKKYPMLDPEYVRSKDDYDRGFRTEEDTSPLAGKEGSRAMKTVAQQSMPATSIADLSKTLDTANSPVAAGFSNSMIEDDKKDKGSSVAPAVAGAALGGTAGQMIGDKLGGSEEDESPLKGKYGHSGKMKEVAKDTSFLDRLKELSGMKK